MVEEIHFSEPKALFDWFSVWGPLQGMSTHHVFRGEDSDKNELVPSSLRKENSELIFDLGDGHGTHLNSDTEFAQIGLEYCILKKFYNLCDMNGVHLPEVVELRSAMHLQTDFKFMLSKSPWIPANMWEIAGIAQHYGLPTRLLDWTFNFNVALYFAAYNSLKKKNDSINMTIWVLNARYFEGINNTTQPTPLKIIRPAYSRNTNMTAQKGLFTLWQSEKNLDQNIPTDREPLDKKIIRYYENKRTGNESTTSKALLYKLTISKDWATVIMFNLSSNGYTTATLFPEFNGVVRYIYEEGESSAAFKRKCLRKKS